MPGAVAVEEDGVGVAVGAGLPDRECPFGVVAEVLDAAQLDGVVVVFAEVAGQVAVGAAPADGDLFQRRPALGGVVVDGSLDQLEAADGTGMASFWPLPACRRQFRSRSGHCRQSPQIA